MILTADSKEIITGIVRKELLEAFNNLNFSYRKLEDGTIILRIEKGRQTLSETVISERSK